MRLHHPHFHFIHFKLKKDLKEVYLSILIRSLAISLIGIFIPLYLLKELSYSLQQVLIFYIVLAVAFALFSPIAARISSKIGLRYSILISIPISIIFYVLLYSLKQFNWSLYLIAIILAIANGFFWLAFHAEFAKFSDVKHRGEEVGVWFSLANIIALSGPLVGGLILTFLNFNILILIVGVFLFISVIPLFFAKNIHTKAKFSLKYVFKKSHLKDLFAFVGYGVDDYASTILLPIFIFSILQQYLQLGAISSITALITTIFIFVIGRSSDKFSKRSLIKFGSILLSISWFMFLAVKNLVQIFGVVLFYGLSFSLSDVPFTAMTYDKANKSNLMEYLVFREIGLCIGRVLLFIVVLAINNLTGGFVFAGIASLLQMLF